MRSIWNATLVIAELAVPVGLVPAQQRADPSFRTLHEPCAAPMQEQQTCSSCGEVNPDRLVRGWEVAPGRFVTVDEADLAALTPAASTLIATERVVALDDVDPLQPEKAYHLLPGKDGVGRRVYLLVARALERNQAGAVCRFVLRGRERVGLVRASGGTLVLQTLHLAEDVRENREVLDALAGHKVSAAEDALADALVAKLTGPIGPSLHSRQREATRALLEGRADAGTIVRADLPAPVVADLSESLRRSLKNARRPSRRAARAR